MSTKKERKRKQKPKLLDIGAGNTPRPEEFPDFEYVTLDADPDTNPDIVHDITKPLPEEHQGQYYVVLAVHILEHIPIAQVRQALTHMRDALQDGGELQVYVPSLDWAAEEIYFKGQVLGQTPTPVISNHIFGMQLENGEFNRYQCHYSGFTLLQLRYLFKMIGLVERHFGQGMYTIVSSEGNEYGAIQINGVGVRNLEYEKEHDQTSALAALDFS